MATNETKPEENDHIKRALNGEDFTLAVDSEFRERLINELRSFPNIFVIAGDSTGSTCTWQGNEQDLAKAVINTFKQKPELFEWFKQVINHV